MIDRSDLPAVVIGGGPAGLATSRELVVRGIDHVVLEQGAVGESWASRVYDSLTLHTGKHMSALPGLSIGRRAPMFIGREAFLEYLQHYRGHFALPVRTGVTVTSVARREPLWNIETNRGPVRAAALVVATGIMSTPVTPHIPGAATFGGTIRHSTTYRRTEECRGRRVLVVGAGNSAGEIASELGRAGVETTISVRSGAHIVPLHILGIPIQYLSYAMRSLPRTVREGILGIVNRVMQWQKGPPPIPRGAQSPFDAIPLIGFRLTDAIRERKVKVRGGIREIVPTGVIFESGDQEPFDEIILATGYRATLDFLPSVKSDERGFGSRRDRVVSIDQPALFYVGHNYDSSGGLFNIRKDSAMAAEGVKSALRRK